MKRWLVLLLMVSQFTAASQNPALDRALADLRKNDGALAEQDIWAARKAGASLADTHHLMAQAYVLEGDAIRALQEADPAQIPPAFAGYARRVRIKADLMRGDTANAQNELGQAIAQAPSDDGLWVYVAQLKSSEGDLAGAIQAAQHAVTLNPQNADSLFLMGTLTRDQSGLCAAIPWFNRALAIAPKNIPILLELAATQGDTGQASAMLATTRRVLVIDPHNPQAFYLQAVLAARAGNYDLARDLLYKTGSALDNMPGVILLQGIIALQSGDSEQAIAHFQLLVQTQPQNRRALRLLGAAYAQAGDDDNVIATLKPLADRADADSYTLTRLARAYEDTDDRAAAASYLDRAALPVRGYASVFDPQQPLDILAADDAGQPNNANTTVPYIAGLILANRAADAVVKGQSLALVNAGVPGAHMVAGDALLAAGQFGPAAQAYQTAAAINLSEPVTLRLINAQQILGDGRGAGQTLARYLQNNPDNIEMLKLRANQAMAQGDWRKVVQILEGLRLRIGDGDPNLLNNLAWSWFNLGHPALALSFSRAAYARAPANPAITNTYGWLLIQTGSNSDAGLALLEKAVEISPKQSGMWFQLGEAYAALGRKADARKVFRALAANAAASEHVEAARRLARL